MADDKKKVVILGSTGSIGVSSLKVAKDLSERIEVVGIGAHRSADKILSQLNETGARVACLSDEEAAESIRTEVPAGVNMLSG